MHVSTRTDEMSLISGLPTTPVDNGSNDNGNFVITGVADGWRTFFNSVLNICNAGTTSGPTANRPTSGLWVGRQYFDTTLNQVVWVQSFSGSAVWVDATGTTNGWTTFYSAYTAFYNAITQNGSSAARPTSGLWIGRPYFDTTLNLPIWVKSIGPNIWINASGGVV